MSEPTTSRKRLLAASDVGDFIIRKKIRTKRELYTEANKRKVEGDNSLYNYIMITRDCNVEEMITKAWDLHNAPTEMIQSLTTRMEVIRQAAEQPCQKEECEWLDSALSLLTWNGIPHNKFSLALRTLLEKGRGSVETLCLLVPAIVLKPIY